MYGGDADNNNNNAWGKSVVACGGIILFDWKPGENRPIHFKGVKFKDLVNTIVFGAD